MGKNGSNFNLISILPNNPTNMTKQCAQYRIVSNRAEILKDRETNQDSR